MAATRLHVLHVEDDFADALLVQNAVCEAGDYDIAFDVARTLREAKRKLKTHKFDLILLDLRLPDSVKPEETFDTIRADCGGTPVLVLSGSTRVDSDRLPEGATQLDKNQHLSGAGGRPPIHLAGYIREAAQNADIQTI